MNLLFAILMIGAGGSIACSGAFLLFKEFIKDESVFIKTINVVQLPKEQR